MSVENGGQAYQRGASDTSALSDAGLELEIVGGLVHLHQTTEDGFECVAQLNRSETSTLIRRLRAKRRVLNGGGA